MELSVVAPCYNEENSLTPFTIRVRDALTEAKISTFEIILVDDGSSDKSWSLIQQIHGIDNRVKGIRLSRNFGHQAALSAGLREARGEQVLIIDADLQDPPELLARMREQMAQGFDVVYGQRKKRFGETVFKKFTAHAFYRLLSLVSEINIPQDTGDFRLINRKVLEAFNNLKEGQRFTRGLIAWLGFQQTSLLYDRDPRFSGVTKYTLKKMVQLSMDAMVGFSLRPIRMIQASGLILIALSLVALITSSTLVTLGLFLGGLQLFGLGIVGEYVGRALVETRRRPLYLIQEKTGEIPSQKVSALYHLSPEAEVLPLPQ